MKSVRQGMNLALESRGPNIIKRIRTKTNKRFVC